MMNPWSHGFTRLSCGAFNTPEMYLFHDEMGDEMRLTTPPPPSIKQRANVPVALNLEPSSLNPKPQTHKPLLSKPHAEVRPVHLRPTPPKMRVALVLKGHSDCGGFQHKVAGFGLESPLFRIANVGGWGGDWVLAYCGRIPYMFRGTVGSRVCEGIRVCPPAQWQISKQCSWVSGQVGTAPRKSLRTCMSASRHFPAV